MKLFKYTWFFNNKM